MRALTYLFFTFAFAANAQTNIFLANDVPIDDRGVSFVLTDEPFTGVTNRYTQFNDKEILADVPLIWILHNTTNRDSVLVSQGIEHVFSLKLFDLHGREIPLTKMGKTMNSGPIIHRKPIAASIHGTRLLPGGSEDYNFPALTNLFQIPRAGEYIFEARYWFTTDSSLKEWQLSDPARLKVIMRPTNAFAK